MAHSCREFARNAEARAGAGLAAIENGMSAPAGTGLSLYAKSELQPLGDERRSEDAQLAAVTEELQAPSLPPSMPIDRLPGDETDG